MRATNCGVRATQTWALRSTARNGGPSLSFAAVPRLDGAHRAQVRAARVGDFLALALLVALRSPDLHPHAVRFEGQVRELEGDKFRSVQGASEAKGQ